MMVRFHGSTMVSVFPESSLTLLPLIELLSGAAGDQLHGPGNYFAFPAVKHEQMDVFQGYVFENHCFVIFYPAILGSSSNSSGAFLFRMRLDVLRHQRPFS
jgi:hypothetical protein